MPEGRHDESSAPRACPVWCGRRHTPHDHPEDLLHQSPPRYAVLVTSPPSAGPDAAPGVVAVATPVVGRLLQRTDSAEVWVEVAGEEDPGFRLAVTAESARRLVTVLDALLTWLPA
jgi:Domain of unknown function (DUF6907)